MRFRVPETALYRIAGGSRVEVTPWPGAEEARIRLYLLGSCMGALLMQRGILPLHGSAVVIEGKAYAIVGQSGAGKSTLAAAFASAGYPLVTDDVIAVSVSHAQEASKVYPSYPQQKLWRKASNSWACFRRISQRLSRVNKYAVPVRSRFHLEPLPLAGVIELSEFSERSRDPLLHRSGSPSCAERSHVPKFACSLAPIERVAFSIDRQACVPASRYTSFAVRRTALRP
ncbi:hypothetical protein ACFSL6_26025 [Paenibacillus thailandensis]|uniref:hypothetical protein n=1 Tax=Paenibacillus thailandensis TaxID=393250 RepID=UPI00363A4FCF